MSTREFDAGSAYLQILPSLRGFADDLKAKLAEIKTGYQVEVTPAVDPAGRAKVAAELADLPAVKVDADLSGVDAKVAELRSRLAELRDKTVALEIDPDEALAEVAAIQAEIDGLSKATAKLDVDTTDATDKVGKVAAEVKALGDEKVVVQVEASLDPGSVEKVRGEIEAEPPAVFRVLPEQAIPAVQYSDPLAGERPAPGATRAPNILDDAWRSQVQSSVNGVATDATHIPVVPDTQDYRARLVAQLAYIGAELEQDIPVEPSDADAYRLEMEGLVKQVEAEVKAKIAIEIDPASVAALEAEAKAAADAASKGASTGSKGRGGGAGMAGLIAGGIGVGAGPLGGAALLTGPAVLAAIGIAAEKSDVQVRSAFASMTTAAKNTLREGFAPFVPTLTSLAGTAQRDITAIEPDLQAAAAATAPLINTLGQGVLKAAQDGIGGAASLIGKLQPEAQAVATGLDQIVHGLGGFFSGINADHATEGLTLLFGDVEQILPAVARLLDSVMPLGNALLQVLGPAVVNTVNGLSALDPVINAVAAVIRFLEPDIAVLGPLFAAGATASKLLTGSWLDFTGAGSKLKSMVTDLPGTIENLGKSFGYTSAAANAASKATLDDANTMAQLRMEVATEAETEALNAASTKRTAAAKLALREAQVEATVATKAAAEAEVALAEATDIATFSFAPLGIALGAVALLAIPFALNSGKAANSAQDLTTQLQQLAAAGPGAAQGILANDPALTALINKAAKAGISVPQMLGAIAAGGNQLSTFTDGVKASADALGKQTVQVDNSGGANRRFGNGVDTVSVSVADLAKSVDGNDSAYKALSDSARAKVDQFNADNEVTGQLDKTTANLTATQQANAQAAIAQGTAEVKLGDLLSNLAADTENYAKAQLAAGATTFQAVATYKQLDQAVTSARQSLAQSAHSVADAQHNEEAAARAVATAQNGVVQAEEGVTKAEGAYQVALGQEKVAQDSLMAARAAAAQQLIDLNRQVTDSADTQHAAQLRLLDAHTAVTAAGLAGRSLASLGPLTRVNEAQFRLLSDLEAAQHNYNDTMAASAKLHAQNSAAQAAGIDGNQGVISATQGVTSAQQSASSAAKTYVDSQAAVVTASQAVKDAQYAQGQAHYATQAAQTAEDQASKALTVAKDNASRSTDNNTSAGIRNQQQLLAIYDADLASGMSADAAAAATQRQAGQLGFTAQQIQAVIDKANSVQDKTFFITGKASVDFSALINSVADPYTLGLDPATVTLARGPIGSSYGDGGPIGGTGGPTEDNIPIWASAREFMQPVSTVDYYGVDVMEAMRRKLIPKEMFGRFASGGLVGGVDLMRANAEVFIREALMGAAGETGARVGFPIGGSAWPIGGSDGVAPAGGSWPGTPGNLQGLAGSNEQIVQQVFQQLYGWGSGAEWAATVPLVMMESGFRNTVKNPTSTALGIFQFLDSTWAGTGIAKTTDPTQQSIAGARYIHDRYRDPLGALAHEQAYHWYDQGGWLPPGLSVVANGTGAPEAVFTKAQWDILAQGIGGRGHDLAGLEISGRLAFDQDGAARLVDGRIERALHAVGSAINSGTR